MNWLRTLGMPLHAASLMFVALVTVCVALGLRNIVSNPVISILLMFMALSWLNKYAFALLDHAANGRREAPVASLEMLGPFNDMRVWVHPSLALVVGVLAWKMGRPGAAILLATGAVLMPASVAATAMSGRLVDALNPVEIFNALRGLGPFYLLTLLAGTLVVGAVWGLWQGALPAVVGAALLSLAMLEWYAVIGASVHLRRFELGFEPIVDPESKALRAETERQRERQKAIDEFYGAIRVRETARATAALEGWLGRCTPAQRAVDVDYFIQRAASWTEQKGLATLVRAVIGHALQTRQGALAVIALEAGLAKLPAFSLDDPKQAEALAVAARQSGRRRLAATVLDNYAAAHAEQPLPEALTTLREELPR
jgi:hypothetical protein